MPSVVAEWRGRCPQRENQLELCRYIWQLARVSHIFYEEYPEIKRFDGKIKGRILLEPGLVEDALLFQYGVRMEEEEADMWDQVIKGIKTELVRWPVLDEAHLSGIEFNLYDPRDGYGGRMSFVFLNHEIPALNGLLVMVKDHEECEYYRSKTIKGADWYLTIPKIDLRYYLEEWFDYLMGWTKYFFIPDLYFWRWTDGSKYCSYLKEQLDSLLLEVGNRSLLRDIVFENIVERFEFEVIEWSKFDDENYRRIMAIMSKYDFSPPPTESIEELITPPQKRDNIVELEEIGKRLDDEIRETAAEQRKAGLPVTDDGRIDMNAFKGVYPPEEVERDKKLVERIGEIRNQELPSVEKLRARIRARLEKEGKLGSNKK